MSIFVRSSIDMNFLVFGIFFAFGCFVSIQLFKRTHKREISSEKSQPQDGSVKEQRKMEFPRLGSKMVVIMLINTM